MKDLKPIIAKNITALRQSARMTQSDLAEQLNYSDKAVSKWERGESTPDITVLSSIAELFGVSVEYLLTENHSAAPVSVVEDTPKLARRRHSRKVITTLSVVLVWFLALLAYVVMDSIPPPDRAAMACFCVCCTGVDDCVAGAEFYLAE